MACDHKFRSHLDLSLLGFEPETLIVGTFNPDLPAGNEAGWFYGRTTDSYFWDVLPRLYGAHSLGNATPAEWKQFCRDHRIALTDLIACIDDADTGKPGHCKILGGFSDDAIIHNFEDFQYVPVLKLLRDHTTIKNEYLTRGATEAFWRYLWNPVAHYCNHNGLHERILLSPTDAAAYHHEAYNRQHPDAQIHQPADYILWRWQQQWHSLP